MDAIFRISLREWFWYYVASSALLIGAPLFFTRFLYHAPTGFSGGDALNSMPGVLAIFGGPILVLALTIVFLRICFLKSKITIGYLFQIFAGWICFTLFTVLCVETYGFFYNLTNVKGAFFLISPGSIGGALLIAASTYVIFATAFFLIARGEEVLSHKKEYGGRNQTQWIPFVIFLVILLSIFVLSIAFTGDPFFLFILLFIPIMLFFGPLLVFFPTAIVIPVFFLAVLVLFGYINWRLLHDKDQNGYVAWKRFSGQAVPCLVFFWFVHFITLVSLFPLRVVSSFFFM